MAQKEIQPDLQDDAGDVYVVVANYADDPHPHVEAVYRNEEEAEEHRKEIAGSLSPAAPVAWKVAQSEVL